MTCMPIFPLTSSHTASHRLSLAPDDVVDFLEAGDTNRDGLLDYKEYMDLLAEGEDEEDEEEQKASSSVSSSVSVSVSLSAAAEKEGQALSRSGSSTDEQRMKLKVEKVQPYGADEVREVILRRRREELERQREERARREVYQEELDRKIFEEELLAQGKKGGANPKKSRRKVDEDTGELIQPASTDFFFATNSSPLRTVITGPKTGAIFKPLDLEKRRRLASKKELTCPKKHKLEKMSRPQVRTPLIHLCFSLFG